MTLKDKLVSTTPQERSGSRASNRLDYQKSWALCHLLDLHENGRDYLFLFDYQDDVLVLDSEDDPKEIDFFQVKTKDDGHWTKTALTARPKGKDKVLLGSILGKLLANHIRFPKHTKSLNLVSNQIFSLKFKGASGSTTRVALDKLDQQELDAILEALRTEHRLPTKPDCAKIFFLHVSSLSLQDHSTHAMGILSKFLDTLYPNAKLPVAAVYRSLCDEIKRRTNVESLPEDFSQLQKSRGLGRKRFKELLADVKPADQFSAAVTTAINQLRHEGALFDELQEIQAACNQLEIDRMNGSDVVLRRARKAIEASILALKTAKQSATTLRGKLQAVTEDVRPKTADLISAKSTYYRSALIVMAIYGF